MKSKDLKFIFEINQKEIEALQKFICTDYNIYEGILFHIVQNAIKFAKSGTQIKIKLDYKQ